MKLLLRAILILGIISSFVLSDLTVGAEDLDGKSKIMKVKGKVEVKFKTNYKWKRAKEGMILTEGDEIRTSRRAYVDIMYYGYDSANKLAVYRIEEKTRIQIGESKEGTAPGTSNFIIELATGAVLAKISKLKKGSEFKIGTPNSIIGVRGTILLVEYDPLKGESGLCRTCLYRATDVVYYVKRGRDGAIIPPDRIIAGPGVLDIT